MLIAQKSKTESAMGKLSYNRKKKTTKKACTNEKLKCYKS